LTLDLLNEPGIVGELAGLMLAVNEVAVDLHIKDASSAFDQLGVDVEGFLELIRQTGGIRCVVSLHAILDRDVHVSLLSNKVRQSLRHVMRRVGR
jgi:hypothetical protein